MRKTSLSKTVPGGHSAGWPARFRPRSRRSTAIAPMASLPSPCRTCRSVMAASRGRHPYMTQDDARELIKDALAAYKNHHKHYPARVIVLKTSQFREEEA